MRACGVKPGDEVITTPFTFFASAEAIVAVGATPVFVDIDPATLNLDPALIEAAITEKTTAILPVDIFGVPAEMAEIRGKLAEAYAGSPLWRMTPEGFLIFLDYKILVCEAV